MSWSLSILFGRLSRCLSWSPLDNAICIISIGIRRFESAVDALQQLLSFKKLGRFCELINCFSLLFPEVLQHILVFSRFSIEIPIEDGTKQIDYNPKHKDRPCQENLFINT